MALRDVQQGQAEALRNRTSADPAGDTPKQNASVEPRRLRQCVMVFMAALVCRVIFSAWLLLYHWRKIPIALVDPSQGEQTAQSGEKAWLQQLSGSVYGFGSTTFTVVSAV